MPNVVRIRPQKQPRRPHYIPEWAEHRGFKTQVELAEELGIDKSTVSRWYNGSSPGIKHQEALAELFNCDPESLFRHPDDDWLARFFKERSREEVQRAKVMLEMAFPKTGTDR